MPTTFNASISPQPPGASVAPVYLCQGAPVDGTSGTYAGYIQPGHLLVDETNANLYINGGTLASPTWKLVTRAA